MSMTRRERLQRLVGLYGFGGYVEYGSRTVEEWGEQVTKRGWWLRLTPDGKPYGVSFKPIYLGPNVDEAAEWLERNCRRCEPGSWNCPHGL